MNILGLISQLIGIKTLRLTTVTCKNTSYCSNLYKFFIHFLFGLWSPLSSLFFFFFFSFLFSLALSSLCSTLSLSLSLSLSQRLSLNPEVFGNGGASGAIGWGNESGGGVDGGFAVYMGLVAVRLVLAPVVVDLAWGNEGGFVLPWVWLSWGWWWCGFGCCEVWLVVGLGLRGFGCYEGGCKGGLWLWLPMWLWLWLPMWGVRCGWGCGCRRRSVAVDIGVSVGCGLDCRSKIILYLIQRGFRRGLWVGL